VSAVSSAAIFAIAAVMVRSAVVAFVMKAAFPHGAPAHPVDDFSDVNPSLKFVRVHPRHVMAAGPISLANAEAA